MAQFKPPKYNSHIMFNYKPDMWINEIKYIENLLLLIASDSLKVRVLEWGSGNSSIYFSLFMKANNINFEWHCIENYIPWNNKVKSFIKENDLQKDVICHLCDETEETDKQKQENMDLDKYLNFPKKLGNFDLILIDGRKRDKCLEIAKDLIYDTGCVILHDAERKELHYAFNNYFDNGEFVVYNDSPNSQGGIQKLWVGKKKKHNTIRVDIDNTICQTIGLDYHNSKPFEERIKKINELYDNGNIIIYWTHREKEYKELTLDQLDKWECKYHGLVMNKPYYNQYIDDKSINSDDFFE